jgi:hypothetical protein
MVMRKVQTGQPLKIGASTFNTFIDVAEAYQRNQFNVVNSPAAASGNSRNLILVQNKTGAALDRFAVVVIDAPVITPEDNLDHFKNTIAFEVVNPAGTYGERVAVLQEPLDDDAIGIACISGVTPCQVNKPADQDYTGVITTNGSNVFSAFYGGPNAVLWIDSGTGDQWAIVCLNNASDGVPLLAVTQEAAQSDAYISVKLVGANGSMIGSAFDAKCLFQDDATAADECLPDVQSGKTVPIYKGQDGVWYLGLTFIKFTECA